MSDSFDDLQSSYGRALRGGPVIEAFYRRFLTSHPDIAPMFANTDMGRQRMALRRGLSIAISHAGGSALVQRPVQHMADVHSRRGHAPVPPHLYPYWVDALVVTLREHDPEFTTALEARWRRALAVVVATFTARY
ncbi:MAG: globin [Xanthomonadales bacterium]|nr:globin [Xanthomonadales bacterium]